VSYREGVRRIAPIGVAALVFGASFGVLARAAGLGVLAPLAMSATTFAGSAQFAATSILRNGGSAAAAVVAAVLLNTRYAPIGISVAPGFRGGRLRRLLESQLIVDESWAVSVGRGSFDPRILLGAGAVLFLCWNAGTALGVIGGGFLGDPNRLGLDAAFPALFLALLAPQVRGPRAALAALLGAAIAAATIPFVAPGLPIVAASVACLAGWRRR
jgi:4-azaleucine resistance transporter AzlC